MRTLLALAAAGMVAVSTVAAAPASQQQPAPVGHEMDLGLGDTATAEGENAGIGPWNFVDDYVCEGTPHEQCEVILVRVENPYEEENAKKGRERANLFLGVNSSIPPAINDFAIRVYESDETGAPIEFIGSADNSAGDVQTDGGYNEEMTVVVTSTPEETVFWYRVEVIFWAAAGDWWLDAEFTQ